MKQHRRAMTLAVALFVAFVGASVLPSAQAPAKKVLGAEDYAKWRSIQGEQISNDGNWVAFGLQLTNVPTADAKPELHIRNLQTDQDVTVAHATNARFSPDSKWIAYLVDPNPGRNRSGTSPGAGGGGGPPTTPPTQPEGDAARSNNATPRRAELRNLATGTVQTWQDIQSITFNQTSTHLVLRRPAPNAPAASGGRGGATPAPGAESPQGDAARSAPTGPRGADTILVDLKTGRHQLLADVGDIAFNKKGDLLAYTVDATVKDGNGLFLFETESGRTTPLDNDANV